jgi:hypothetical protein
MSNHGNRGHAAWSASASARNFACPGALRLCATIEQPPESEAAAWGTACHQLSEMCLTKDKDAADFIGTVQKTSQHEIEVDEELAETAQVYIDYVHSLKAKAAWVKLEEYFSLESFNPPVEAGGTADCTAWLPHEQLLEVVDLKGGRGVYVNVLENKQLRTYALGALCAHPGLPVERVKVTIVQPRIPRGGPIRSETFHVTDLLDWTGELLDAMEAATKADAKPVAGDHCTSTFCPAAGVCPALQEKAMQAARAHFDVITGDVHVPNTPDSLMPEEIARILDGADMIQGWLNAVRAYAFNQAEIGVVIPGYILVDKQARKKWIDENYAAQELAQVITDGEIFNNPKLKTPAQIQKLLGKTYAASIEHLFDQKSSGKNLVRADKTTRPPVKAGVQQHFDVLD